MIHSLLPSDFVEKEHLSGDWNCPNCKKQFMMSEGYVFFVPFMQIATGTIQWGFGTFCSTTCILEWYPATYMGRG